MTTENLEKFQQKYHIGKTALEKGNYRLSITNLEAAQELVAPNSRQGGETGIWLVTAYQAADQIEQAIALCEKLITHPNSQTREQAQHILYIIKAPKLKRPKEWMSEIPDLSNTDTGQARYVTAKKPTPAKVDDLPETLESPPTETPDNQFIWFALLLIALILGSLFWLN